MEQSGKDSEPASENTIKIEQWLISSSIAGHPGATHTSIPFMKKSINTGALGKEGDPIGYGPNSEHFVIA